MTSTTDIYNSLGPYAFRDIELRQGSDYVAKMMHQIPDTSVVDREKFILERCKGKRVLNLGCASGTLHSKIKTVATEVIGVDRQQPCDMQMDLDSIDDQFYSSYDYIIAGEILEHLSNPGNLLMWLRQSKSPLIITVPNAFHVAGLRWMKEGYEQVNPDHVAWYSYKTMKTLVERYSFTIQEFYWYNGKPLTAEGMIFVVS